MHETARKWKCETRLDRLLPRLRAPRYISSACNPKWELPRRYWSAPPGSEDPKPHLMWGGPPDRVWVRLGFVGLVLGGHIRARIEGGFAKGAPRENGTTPL